MAKRFIDQETRAARAEVAAERKAAKADKKTNLLEEGFRACGINVKFVDCTPTKEN